MPEQWYWKHRGDLLGPLETVDLEHLVQQNRVFDNDEVRLATQSEWLTGAEVKAIFSGKDQKVSTSEAAAQLLSRSNKIQNTKNASIGSREGILSTLTWRVQMLAENLLGQISDAGRSLGEAFAAGLGSLAFLLNRKVILALVAVICLSVVVIQVRNRSNALNQSIMDELTAIADQVNTLQSSGASADQWRAFRDATLPQLDATLKSMTRDSTSNFGPVTDADSMLFVLNPQEQWANVYARRSLIQAMHAMKSVISEVNDSRAESPSLELFRKNIAVARNVLNGRHVQRVKLRAVSVPHQKAAVASANYWGWGGLTLNGLLAAGGIGYWLFRDRNEEV